MAVTDNIYLSGLTETTSTAPGPVGQIREDQDPTYGYRKFRMVKNTSGASIAAGLAVSYAAGSSVNVALSANGDLRQQVAGVTVAAIPNNYWGWVCCAGQVVATAATAIASTNLRLRTTGVGKVDDTAVLATEDEWIGIAITAPAAPGSVTIRLSGLL